MPVDDQNSTSSGVSRTLHRGLGFPVIGMIAYGWWMLRVPQFTSSDKAAARLSEDWQFIAAYALLAIVIACVVAAINHDIIKRDEVTVRMLSHLGPSVTS